MDLGVRRRPPELVQQLRLFAEEAVHRALHGQGGDAIVLEHSVCQLLLVHERGIESGCWPVVDVQDARAAGVGH